MNSRIVAGAAAAGTAAAIGIALTLGHAPAPVTAPDPAAATTNTSLANWDHVRPLRSLTPGVTDPRLTFQVLSAPGFTTKDYRNVPDSEKTQVYVEYGIDPKKHPPTEIDHDVSIELGGANLIGNLWPELFSINVNGLEMGAHEKDKVEDVMGRLVKSGKLPLSQAQTEIRTDWTIAYQKYIGPFPKFTGKISGAPEGE